ncbi:hypothetical protein BDC45DRAFT_530397 [Circinella umbellata]|nr:hypothetical protein BDC45DRAFT_530397 [Circinella umbellata]
MLKCIKHLKKSTKIYPPYGSKSNKEIYKFVINPSPPDYLTNETIVIDQNILKNIEKVYNEIIDHLQKAGATVCDNYSQNVTIAVAESRSSYLYLQAFRDGKVVASYRWLTNTILRIKNISPLSTVIDYPYPKGGIPVDGAKLFHLSAYRDTERYFLTVIGVRCGLIYSPMLTQKVTFFICPTTAAVNYTMALNFDVEVVNHVWLEESFRNWVLHKTSRQHYIVKEQQYQQVGETQLSPSITTEKNRNESSASPPVADVVIADY